MKTIRDNNLIFIRLFSNEDLINCIIDACKKYNTQTAIVLSAIGQLKQSVIGYYKVKDNYIEKTVQTPHELLSLSGNIVSYKGTYQAHLHVILGNEDKQTIGGHLIKGTVEVTNEIVLLTSQINLERQLSEETGLLELILPTET